MSILQPPIRNEFREGLCECSNFWYAHTVLPITRVIVLGRA